jgi:DNA-binding LacI/PurR family transcriptional regulator
MSAKSTTIKDIAKAVGVSPRSVSLAINNQGRLSAATRERILRVAAEMDYHPNVMARGLVSSKTFLLGVVVPYLTSSFFSNIISGIEEESIKQHYDIILGSASRELASEKWAIQRMVNRKVDGIICCPDPRFYELYQGLVSTGIPLLEIMTHVKGTEAVSILVDDRHGGHAATTHLLDLGHRNIGFIKYNADYYEEIRLRNEGYRQALIERGVSLDLSRCEIASDLTRDGSYKAAVSLLRANPDITAIFAPTDVAAIGALGACLDAGRKVPQDISVVGYDDSDFARYQAQLPLTTISQPKEEVGRLAFLMIHRMILGESVSSVSLLPELVTRSTTTVCPPMRTAR